MKTTESGRIAGFDAGKTGKGRRRHILTDTEGFIATAPAPAADIQDRDGAPSVLAEARAKFRWPRRIFAADGEELFVTGIPADVFRGTAAARGDENGVGSGGIWLEDALGPDNSRQLSPN